jgi:hypothetical protein
MKKVYVLFVEHEIGHEKFTDILQICNDEDLAVEYANSFVNDSIHDSLREEHDGFVWVERQEGKYYNKEELYRGCCYLAYGDHKTDSIIESYSITMEECEVKED